MKTNMVIVPALLSLMIPAVATAGGHEGDVIIGRNAANKLALLASPESAITVLAPADGGWSDSNPGYDHLATDRPAEDIFRLGAGCQLRLEVVSLDPAIVAVQLGTFIVLDSPGDRFILRPSGPNLHEHPVWFVDETLPGYDPEWTIYHATFRIIDTGSTGYLASDDFTLKFATASVLLGDMNCDGVLSVGDISGFVEALTNAGGYAATYPDCDVMVADTNSDGVVSVGDIAGFVALLTSF